MKELRGKALGEMINSILLKPLTIEGKRILRITITPNAISNFKIIIIAHPYENY